MSFRKRVGRGFERGDRGGGGGGAYADTIAIDWPPDISKWKSQADEDSVVRRRSFSNSFQLSKS